jgi:hypothetical protein
MTKERLEITDECLKRFKTNREREYMMHEDDMSFMEPIFMNRQLPYPEYLTECGYHHVTRDVYTKSPNEGAMRDMLRKYGAHFHAKYQIPCKGGAVFNVSVISGMMFYSRTDAPYEISGPTERDEDDNSDPLPYQTDEDLMLYLAKLIAKAEEY